MINRIVCVLVLAALLTVLAVGVADSASFTYASHRKEIKAGVLIFPGWPNGPYTTPAAPYVFHVLNQRTDIKPQGWEFVNPLAPSLVTDDIKNRWTGRGAAYRVGDQVSKDMGCYWEVKIDAGLAELSQFDILYIGLEGTIKLITGSGLGAPGYPLGRHYREKLRKLVDAGGVLWIENCSTGGAALGDFITSPTYSTNPDIQFGSLSGSGLVPAGAPNPLHPLVHRPYDLSWDELSKLGTDSNELSGSAPHFTGHWGVAYGDLGDRYYMTVVGLKTGSPIMMASQYGSGHIVASAENIGYAVSTFGSNGNTSYCPTDRFALAPSEDLKAAANIISWGGEHTSFHKDARHTGYSYDEVGAPLALKWEFDQPSAPGVTASSPAILNDMVFYVDAGGFLHAFDLSPAQDLNGDGNSDDYVATDPPASWKLDYKFDLPYDEVWSFDCKTAAGSSPTVAYVPVGGGKAIPAVFVATMEGNILAFEAMTGAPLMGKNPIMQVNRYDKYLGTSPLNVPAPTYFDGVVYVGDGEGWLLCANLIDKDPVTGASPRIWTWPYSPIPNLPPTLNSPTVGYFRNPISGSVDQLVYLASRGKPGSVNGCIYSFPIKVFNEVLTPSTPTQYKIRKGIRGNLAINKLAPYQLYRTKPQGGTDAIPATVVGPDTFQVAPGDAPLPGESVIADYEVDNSGTGAFPNPNPPPVYRQRIDVKNAPPSPNPPGFGVISTPAAGPNDTLYYGTENGSFYAVIEDGWGITTKWRWYLGDPGVSATLGIPASAKIVGSPAVGNDMVYYAVNASDGGGPGCILAFHANPVFRINVDQPPIDPRRPIEVLQYDSMNPGKDKIAVSGAAEGVDTSRRRVAFKIDYEKGRITFENFLDPLSASQDLIVRYFRDDGTGSGPGTQIEDPPHQAFPAANTRDSWNNLAWCLQIPGGVAITSSPMLMGSILYFGDSNGRLHQVDVQNVTETTAERQPVAPKKYDNYWIWPDPDPPAPEKPQLGLGGPILSTVAGAHGNIAISSAEGLAVLCNGLTLVADGHRILEMDVSGRIVWSCDGTTSYAGTRLRESSAAIPVYGAAKTSFNKPSVARRVGTSNILVADTGNNRIVLVDRAGNALVNISEFYDPLLLLSANSLPSDPLQPHKLNSPTDVWMTPVMDPVSGTMAYRFLIADSGNYRVIEVDSIFDQTIGRYGPPILRWTSRTMQQGKRYRYISARRYRNPAGGEEVICIVNDLVPEPGRLETTGGAIVTLDGTYGSPSDPAYLGGLIIMPDGIRRFANWSDGSTYDLSVAKEAPIRLVNPTFFTREFRTGATFTDIIADANGLYVEQFAVGTSAPVRSAKYLATQHSTPLQISYAQLLPSGNILVTSKASNPALGASTKGEIFELSSDLTTVLRSYSAVQIGRRKTPTGEDQKYSLEQPSSAERLLQ